MYRKIAILIPKFFLCLGLDNCKSPEASEPEPIYEYRYNVKVIYTRVAVDPMESPDYKYLSYHLYDPAVSGLLAFLESPTRVSDIVGREDCVSTVNSNGQSD